MQMNVLSWKIVNDLVEDVVSCILQELSHTHSFTLYGVPRGGVYTALMIQGLLARKGYPCQLTNVPTEADVIVDDVVDSRRTKTSYIEKFQKPFYALITKQLFTDWIVFPWEDGCKEDGPEENIIRLLEYIGEDPNREGLKDTPKRVLLSYSSLFSGYKQKPEDLLKVFTV